MTDAFHLNRDKDSILMKNLKTLRIFILLLHVCVFFKLTVTIRRLNSNLEKC